MELKDVFVNVAIVVLGFAAAWALSVTFRVAIRKAIALGVIVVLLLAVLKFAG